MYTVSRKRCHSTYAYNFAKCRLIFKILSPTDLAVNFWQTIIKYPTTPETYRYTTLPCETFVLKNCLAPELSEANCNADSATQTIAKNKAIVDYISPALYSVQRLAKSSATNDA